MLNHPACTIQSTECERAEPAFDRLQRVINRHFTSDQSTGGYATLRSRSIKEFSRTWF
jgi:hypothetical protein